LTSVRLVVSLIRSLAPPVPSVRAAGDEIILSDDSYGGTYRILDKVCRKMKIGIK
jgi:cystathionine beta-lyase/cystathionine gamma-synthase